MGNNITIAVFTLWALCIVAGALLFRWRGAALALVIPVVTYPLFLVWYAFVQYWSVLPKFSPAGAWKADLYAPWKTLAIPALPALLSALVVVACIRNAAQSNAWSWTVFRTYFLLAFGSYVVVAVWYTVGMIGSWRFLDAYASSLQLGMLGLLAIGFGLWKRSVTTAAALLIAALPLWLVGVMVARCAVAAGALALSGVLVTFS